MSGILMAATQPQNLFLSDIPLIVVSTVVTVVLMGILLGARRAVAGPGLRDVLGISATFVALTWFAWLMIVGEHALG